MMTRKDYVLLAKFFEENLELDSDGLALMTSFAELLDSYYLNFQKARFLKACGFKEEGD